MPLTELLSSIEFSREFFISLGAPGIFAVAFFEFFFLPIPPDLVLVSLTLAKPEFAPIYASIATSGSVFAGLVGYTFGRKGGRPLLESQFSSERIKRTEDYFERSGFATVTIGAFAPIPEGYELLSVTSGVFGFDARSYLLASVLGRGSKYLVEAAVVVVLGDMARSLSETDLYLVLGFFAIVIIAGYSIRR